MVERGKAQRGGELELRGGHGGAEPDRREGGRGASRGSASSRRQGQGWYGTRRVQQDALGGHSAPWRSTWQGRSRACMRAAASEKMNSDKEGSTAAGRWNARRGECQAR